jgi:hypothetical protein
MQAATAQQPILSEDDVRQQISDLTRLFPDERQALEVAMKALGKKAAKAHLAITFRQPDLLSSGDAREYLQKAIEDGIKLTESDKTAITTLELEKEQIEYDLAKFHCDTTKTQYAMLEKQLSFYQTLANLGD